MSHRLRMKVLAVCVAIFAACSLNTSAAYAQSSDIQSLLDRINRLEADLNNVQRKVYQGQDVPAPNFSSASGGAISGGGEAAALLSTRLDALEEEQRQVTGSMEEIHFKQNQLTTRLNKLVLDIDFRLTEIERRQAGTGDGSGLAVGQAVEPATIQNNIPSEASSPVAPVLAPDLPKGSQILGTLRMSPGSTTLGRSQALAPAAPSTPRSVALAPSAPITTGSPAQQYNYAISLIRKDDYAAAEMAFSGFLERNKDHALAGNAQYWLGETFYVRGDYANAASAFLNGYQVYPDNSKAADNLLKLAMTLGRMDQKEEACATFQQLDKQFTKLAARLKRIESREKKKFACQ